jgi:hypothetical protein
MLANDAGSRKRLGEGEGTRPENSAAEMGESDGGVRWGRW